MSAHLPHDFDPLTGLPVIRVIAAVHRLLSFHGSGAFAPRASGRAHQALWKKLTAEVPVRCIGGADFFRWSDFVRFLEAQMTVQADEA